MTFISPVPPSLTQRSSELRSDRSGLPPPGPTATPYGSGLDHAALRAAAPSRGPSPHGGHALATQGLTLSFGPVTPVDDVTLTIAPGEIFALLGPSGSGKSSLLRLLAGLERPTAGRIFVDGVEIAGPSRFTEPERRRIGMVFQDYALFPHLTVWDNVVFGLRERDGAASATTATRLLDGIGLSARARCYPHMLSGGERQRVALARALAPAPRVLLMDEPFSGLDAPLRDRIRTETIAMLRRSATTTVVVTHDPAEALRIADHIGLLDGGRLVQAGTPAELYRRPASVQAARTFGALNAFSSRLVNGAVQTPLGRFVAPGTTASGPVTVCVRPEHVLVRTSGVGIPGRVVQVRFVGAATEVHVVVDGCGEPVLARTSGFAGVGPSDAVRLTADPDELMMFAPHGPRVADAVVAGGN